MMARRILEIILFSIIFTAGLAYSVVRTVPGTFATITAAINASASGDTVMVTDGGTYRETINFNNHGGVVLRAQPGTAPLIQYNGAWITVAAWNGNVCYQLRGLSCQYPHGGRFPGVRCQRE